MAEYAATPRDAKFADAPTLLPPVDVVEDATGITLYADLPGVSRENLTLEIEGDTLTIDGAITLRTAKDMEVTHAEVSVPRFRRVFTLSRDLDTGKLQAELRNGVLKLHIQRAEHAKPRRIEVTAA